MAGKRDLRTPIVDPPNTRRQSFFFDSNLRFGGSQSNVPMVFTRFPREDSFSVSRALGGKCRRLSRFCNNCYRM